MKLALRNPEDLHPVRWLAWLQHVVDSLLKHPGASVVQIAHKVGCVPNTFAKYLVNDWQGDNPDPCTEPIDGASPGRPPKGFVLVVEKMARLTGHPHCDLRRWLVYQEWRYLLQYDETEVSFVEWRAWILAHYQYLGLPSVKTTKGNLGVETIRKRVDAIGMNGDLAAEIYAKQLEVWREISEAGVQP